MILAPTDKAARYTFSSILSFMMTSAMSMPSISVASFSRST